MKSLLLAMTFALSASAFAAAPATQAIATLLASGNYEGRDGSEKCSVSVSTQADSVTVMIKNKKTSMGFTVVDSDSNYNVNEKTGALTATQKLTAPHYVQGASKVLNVTPNNDQVEFYITTLATDHRGNDLSSYASCTVAL